MLGLDRAGLWVLVELPPEIVLAKLCRYFNRDYEEKISRKSQTLDVDHDFIDKFRVAYKPKGARLDIYFNYPRVFKKTNLHPLTEDLQKILAEEKIIEVLKAALGKKSSNWNQNFFDLEVAMQFKTSSIHHYHKPLRFIFLALSEKFYSNNKCYYSDYSKFFKKFLDTGFTFQLDQGVKFKIYAKGIEHNKKTGEKTRETSLRGELTLSTNGLKKVAGTTEVDIVSIKLLEKKVTDYFSHDLLLHKKLEDAFIEDIRYLEDKFRDFNPRELKSMVIGYSWKGLDDSIFCYVVEKASYVKKRQLMYQKARVREALIEEQERGDSKKSNFNNLKRLEELMKKIFLLDTKIQFKKNKKIEFILSKKCSN